MATGDLSFLDLQNAVMSDRFDEEQRGDVKKWINFRYWWLWHLEEWTFRYGTDLVAVTSGSQAVSSMPADFLVALSLQRSDGSALDSMGPAAFQRAYYDATSGLPGTPESYTVIGNAIYVGPTSNETKTDYQLVYEREYTPLVDDDDVPALPTGAHFGLVHGGAAEGLKLQNDPTWQAFETDFNSVVQILRRGYLVSQRDRAGSYPADPLGW